MGHACAHRLGGGLVELPAATAPWNTSAVGAPEGRKPKGEVMKKKTRRKEKKRSQIESEREGERTAAYAAANVGS